MALQLLGSKYCIESLRSDVTDVQESILDVMSRAGPLRQPSWKYPDKIGCDLDMTQLLELYDYSEDEEDRQISHIVLLELVIDRLVLLIQMLTKYLEGMNVSGRATASPQIPHTNNTSIGLVVKKYWNKVVSLQSLLHGLRTENKNGKHKTAELENNLKKAQQEKELLEITVTNLQQSLQTSKSPFPLSDCDLDKVTSRASSTLSISRDECNKATQTVETAFVPCEACDCIQKNYRRFGDTLINLCKAQGLPSCLVKFKPQVRELDLMTANDVIRWSAELGKDVERIEKHLADFDAVRDQLTEAKATNNKLNQKIADLNKEIRLEKETQNSQRKHFETKMKDIQKKGESDVSEVKRKYENLNKGKARLEEQLGQMRGELDKQQELMAQLETAKATVESELHESRTNNAQVKSLERDIEEMEGRLREVNGSLEGAKTELNKERAKCASMTKHMESVQGRQASLVQRLEDLDQDNEQLKSEIAELEDTREELEKELHSATEERDRLQGELEGEQKIVKEITREKKTLEKSMVELKSEISQLEATIQEAKEHEKLLVEYPDLNGPVNTDFAGTGDIAKDMENQVKANSLRIQVLEEQNTKLRNSITKILQSQANALQASSGPMPLWKTSSSPENYAEPAENVSPQRKPKIEQSETKVRESFVIGKGSKTMEKKAVGSKSGTTRPPSSKGNKLGGAYSANQNADRGSPAGRPSSGQSDRSYYRKSEVLMCPKCDKIYGKKRDLDIHQSYCQG